MANLLTLEPSAFLEVSVTQEVIDRSIRDLEAQRQSFRLELLDPVEGFSARVEQENQEIVQIDGELRQHAAGTEVDLAALVDLDQRRLHLFGDASNSESMLGLQALVVQRDTIPQQQAATRAQIEKLFHDVHAAAMDIFAVQREACHGAADFVAQNELCRQVGLEFGAELRPRDFLNSWVEMVNKQRLSEFAAVSDPGERDVLLDGVDLGSAETLFTTLRAIEARLGTAKGASNGQARALSSIMRSAFKAEDLLSELYGLRWLEGQYAVRSSGHKLSELSPGQRGLVLLMFYLLVDASDRPLLLDQPEENLDNQTVRNLLIPALRSAIARRQVVAVTHNPNLAIVGDADQLIAATYADGSFQYTSGSLAQHKIGSQTIDVLEGTREAFDNREQKYDYVVGRSA